MQKWEYFVIRVWLDKDGHNILEALINGITSSQFLKYSGYIQLLENMGREGWELVTVVNAGQRSEYILHFKRPIEG